jgi:hypothetical protein
MSDRKALAREIAARSKPRFIEIPREPKNKATTEDRPVDLKGRARAIASQSEPRFIEIPRRGR